MRMSVKIWLKAILLAGVITGLLNFNILDCEEELLIGVVSCLFFVLVFELTRQFIKDQFFDEIDLLFRMFCYLKYSLKDNLIEGGSLVKWIELQLLLHRTWSRTGDFSFRMYLIQLYHITHKDLLLRAYEQAKLLIENKKRSR